MFGRHLAGCLNERDIFSFSGFSRFLHQYGKDSLIDPLIDPESQKKTPKIRNRATEIRHISCRKIMMIFFLSSVGYLRADNFRIVFGSNSTDAPNS